MKKTPVLLCIATLLWSCASAPSPEAAAPDSAAPDSAESPRADADTGDSEYETRQDDFGFLYIDLTDDSLPQLEFRPYSIVFALNSILSHTGLNSVLEPRYKLALADYLFSGYPADHEGVYRETAVPEYFQNGDPLVFQQRALQPGANSEVSADGILVIQTNLFLDPDSGSIDPRQGRFGSMQENIAFIFLITPDGRLISTQHMKSSTEAPTSLSGDTPPAEILAAVESILYTGRDSEQDSIPELLESLQLRDSLGPEQQAMTQLNRFLYLLRTDRPGEAATALSKMRQDPELADNPGIQRVIESEADGMLEVYRELQSR